jgi:ribonuclease T1
MYKIRSWNKLLVLALTIFLLITFVGCGSPEKESPTNMPDSGVSSEKKETDNVQDNTYLSTTNIKIEKGLRYTSKEEVAAYIHDFHELPPNYLTKKEAQNMGWDNSKGNLWDVTDQKSIGGDYFYNREGLLPKAEGRLYYECDINYSGGYRGAERIVYSNDGLIFYTDDHYESFERIY